MKKNIITSMWFTIFSLFFFSCKKGADVPVPIPASLPVISVQDVSQPQSVSATTMRFYFNSNKSMANAISVDYVVVDGTATSPLDYTPISGRLTIPANQTQATVDVQIKGDPANVRFSNLQFTIQLSNPIFCTLSATSAKGTIITEDGTNLPTPNTGYTTPLSYPGYTLVWNDEFSGTNLDAAVWNQEIGNGSNGWGNNELEYYTNSLKNTFLSNGNLIIEARKEAIGGFNYSSGRMTSQNKKLFKFGRIDIRAKLPVTKGIWPALWMLGSNISTVGWPSCGEIDIMELVGSNPNRVSSTLHWSSLSNTHASKGADYYLPTGNFSNEFHVFSVLWVNNSIKTYVDDILFSTVTYADMAGSNNPFNANQFFIFNVAVGGDWPGAPDATSAFPQRMFVDYVRVFQ